MKEEKHTKNVIGFLSTGRLGVIIMESLIRKNYKVKIVTRDSSQEKFQYLKKIGVEIYEIDFNNTSRTNNLITENSSIYVGNIYQIEINKKIINLIKKTRKNIDKLVFISGANTKKINKEYGKLEDFENEIIFQLPKAIIVKPTMIFGKKNDNNIGKIIKWLKKFPIFPIIGNGKTLYQPVHYTDLKNAIIKIFETNNIEGKKIIIGGRKSFQYIKMIKIIKQKINSKSLIIKFPRNITYFIAIIIVKIFRIKIPIEQIKTAHINRNVDNSEVIKLLKYNPKSFEQRLEESLYEHYDI